MLLLAFVFGVVGAQLLEPARKQLAGNEMGKYRAQDFTQFSSTLGSSFVSYPFKDGSTSLSIDLAIDSEEYFQFTVGHSCSADLDFRLLMADGSEADLQRDTSENIWLGDTTEVGVPVHTWSFTEPQVGKWLFTASLSAPEECNVVIAINNFHADSQYDVSLQYAWSHHKLSVGTELSLLTRAQRNTSKVSIERSTLFIREPSGSVASLSMADNGLMHDGTASDGVWGGVFTPQQQGDHVLTVLVTGHTEEGVPFQRSLTELFRFVDTGVKLTGAAKVMDHPKASSRILLALETTTASSEKYRAYAEVYGTDAQGLQVPVAWVSSIVTSEEGARGTFVTLELDLDWLRLAGASMPLTLKHVSLQSLNEYTNMDLVLSMDVQANRAVKETLFAVSQEAKPSEISDEMRLGIRPFQIAAVDSFNHTDSVTPIMLTHGYCASRNPWELFSWNAPHFFRDFDQNRRTDDFAILLFNFAASEGISDRWVGIGHSQGGNALTHLLNYYWSGLDSAQGRRIQSLGAPFLGSNIAGNVALLGSIFGIGCGSNNDLTRSGASAWAAGITSDVREQVNYWTTTYQLGTLFGDWCLLAANTILAWPNDGTTEYDFAHLSGAVNMGNTERQCHCDCGMQYMAQYYDNARAHDMNEHAF